MADLKTTIAQTENLKNKVKLAKQRINETVVRGGGIASKSLSEIPDNINKMLKDNYKKVAIINITQHIDVPKNTSFRTTKVNLNLTFQPSMIFVLFENSANGRSKDIMSSKEHYNLSTSFSRSTLVMYITSVTKNGFNLNIRDDTQNSRVEIKQIIAIE